MHCSSDKLHSRVETDYFRIDTIFFILSGDGGEGDIHIIQLLQEKEFVF